MEAATRIRRKRRRRIRQLQHRADKLLVAAGFLALVVIVSIGMSLWLTVVSSCSTVGVLVVALRLYSKATYLERLNHGME